MKRIVTAGILIPLVLVFVFMSPGWQWLFVLFVAGVSGLAGWEYLGLAERSGAKPPRLAVMAALLALFAGSAEWPDRTAPLFGILSLALLVCCAFRRPVERVMADASACLFCLFYVGLTLITVPAMREDANGPSQVAFLLCVVWAGDIAALYVGRNWGRRKMAPYTSPNKTWEGAAGSMAGSLLVAGILLGMAALLQSWNSARLSYPDGVWYWLGMAVLVNVAAQVGDLVESALKRSAGVKDSGTLLPGHGGVLDRIDALLLAAPVLWYAQVIHQMF